MIELNKIYNEDCRETMKRMDDNSIDSIVTDPPYELGFMGKHWDSSGIAYNVGLWKECLRVLKPGGYLLAFGGTRTSHRMVCAIEDAGFEIRDSILWLYGSGFPKSLNIGKEIDKLEGAERELIGEYKWPDGGKRNTEDHSESEGNVHYGHDKGMKREVTKGNSEYEGWGTALKPAHEPICVARKPLSDGGFDFVKSLLYLYDITYFNDDTKWRVRRVNPAVKRKNLGSSSITELQKMVEVSVKTVSGKEIPDIGREIEKLLGNRQENIEKTIKKSITKEAGLNTEPTESGYLPTGKPINEKENLMQSENTGESASVVGSQDGNFSPLITSTEEGDNTERNLKHQISISSLKNQDTQKTNIDCSAQTAISQWVCMDIVHTVKITYKEKDYYFEQLYDGSFIWNEQLEPYITPKPLTVAQNVLKYGTGGINIDGCRIEHDEPEKLTNRTAPKSNGEKMGNFKENGTIATPSQLGRFPANVILDGSDCILSQFPESKDGVAVGGKGNAKSIYGSEIQKHIAENQGYGGCGSASRFFYIAKADQEERNAGLHQFKKSFDSSRPWCDEDSDRGRIATRLVSKSGQNFHPTVKPLKLIQYLQRLVTPKGGLTYDPFGGSGTAALSANNEGFDWILSELIEQHCDIAQKRIYNNAGLFLK